MVVTCDAILLGVLFLFLNDHAVNLLCQKKLGADKHISMSRERERSYVGFIVVVARHLLDNDLAEGSSKL